MFPPVAEFAKRRNGKRSLCSFEVVILIWLLLVLNVQGQSTRPGWGATPYNGGFTFRVWAPHATSVTVPGIFNNWSTTATPLVQEMTNGMLDGVWSVDVAGVTNDSQYKFYLMYNGSGNYKHDPRARWVTAAGGGSGNNDIAYNPTNFNWNGDSLTPPAINDLVIYELHMGTFPSGTTPSRLVSATNQLPYLKNLGVSAVEIMPVMEFGNSGNSWGYDPAQPFAVDNSQYGGPDAMKTFVQAAHRYGIAVLLDVVHNHYGPDDLDMWNFDGWTGTNSLGGGIYFAENDPDLQITPWADTRPNFSSNQVCSFIQDNISMWLNEYHVDGFRWDAASALVTDNGGNYIPAGGNLVNAINGMIHTNYPGKISIAEDLYNSYGFDSAWDTSYPYSFTPVLAQTSDASRDMTTVADDILNNVRYGGTAGSGRVVFLEDHDVVGDLNSGVRLVTAIDSNAPASYYARKLSTLGAAFAFTAPGIPMIFQGQEMLESAAFDSGLDVAWSKTNTYSGIVRFYHDLINARRNLGGTTPGLKGSQCTLLEVDNTKKVVAFNRWSITNASQNAVVIGNFTTNTIKNYSLSFPAAGTWYVQLNSDWTNYSSDYGNSGSSVVTTSGSGNTGSVTIGPYSALILSQVPPVPSLSTGHSNNVLKVSWPTAPTGWLLYSSSSLAANAAWSEVSPALYQTNGATIFINVNAASGNLFYRLQKQ